MVLTRVPMQSATRAAAVRLLTGYAADAGVKLQIYGGRPRSIAPPTGFIDRLTETAIEFTTNGAGTRGTRQRTVVADIVVIWASLDSLEETTQKDGFGDGFSDWVADRFHEIAPNTTCVVLGSEDTPNYVPEWMPPAEQRSYYATLIRLEGFAAT